MKNKIFSFVLDLFKNGDKEERAGIFAQVKIYRSTSARVFEFIVGILVLAMWLLTIRNIIHATSDDLPYLLLLAGMGTFFPIACLLHSYHPKANDFPFVKIVNARQVYYLSLLGRYAALWSALFWLWISCMDFIGSEPVFVGGVIVCCVLLCLNGVFFFYKIYQLRNLVEVEDPEPAIKNEKLFDYRCIGIDGGFRFCVASPADLGLYAKDIKWIFKRNPRHSNGSRYRLGMQEILRPFP